MKTLQLFSVGFLIQAATGIILPPNIPGVDQGSEEDVKKQDLGPFPYNPIAFMIDMSTYAYNLHGQSIAFPFDPYYTDTMERGKFMDRVRDSFENPNESYRGYGGAAGFPKNKLQDPIMYNYDQVYPWSDALVKGSTQWIVYDQLNATITNRIKTSFIVTKTTMNSSKIKIKEIKRQEIFDEKTNKDIIYIFEGATGNKGNPNEPESQSLMGFVLFRYNYTDAEKYDVIISFRGSRSGKLSQSAGAVKDKHNTGNPDWTSDLGTDPVNNKFIHGKEFGDEPMIMRGMEKAFVTTIPQIYASLNHFAKQNENKPTNIYITGHSLGAGLAEVLACHVIMGDMESGPTENHKMPASIKKWPWKFTKLISISAPAIFEKPLAEKLTYKLGVDHFFDVSLESWDQKAIGILNSNIIPTLINATKTYAYRVLHPNDPITSTRLTGLFAPNIWDKIGDTMKGGAEHVGQTLYLEQPQYIPKIKYHDPFVIRGLLTDLLKDTRIPPNPMYNKDYNEFGYVIPNSWSTSHYKSIEGHTMALKSIENFYSERHVWEHKKESLEKSWKMFKELLKYDENFEDNHICYSSWQCESSCCSQGITSNTCEQQKWFRHCRN